MSDREYWGRYTPGMFKPLSAAIWSRGRDDEDAIHAAADRERTEKVKRYRALGPCARNAYITFHSLSDEYVAQGYRKSYLPHLRFWARRLEYCENRGM